MSEAPERITVSKIVESLEGKGHSGMMVVAGFVGWLQGGVHYVRADRHDEAIRQRDVAVEACRDAEETIRALRISLDAVRGLSMEDSLKAFETNVAPIRAALAACTPSLPRADVKTGKVITSAELIERTDTPEIRGAVAPEGGGRHT